MKIIKTENYKRPKYKFAQSIDEFYIEKVNNFLDHPWQKNAEKSAVNVMKQYINKYERELEIAADYQGYIKIFAAKNNLQNPGNQYITTEFFNALADLVD